MEANSLLKSATKQLTGVGGTGVSENLLIPVRVVDIILDINHPEANKHGGYDAVGTIFYAEVYINEGEEYPALLRTAKPMFQFIKQYPLKNEIVVIMSNPGTNIYNPAHNASTYYLPNINIWNHPHHNALPDMRYFTNDQSQKDDYEMVNGGLVRTVEDGSTDIPLGEYFKEKLKIQPLLPFEGDTIIEGRFGNSIRLGANAKDARDKTAYSTVGETGDPITIIRNGQQVEEDNRGWEHTVENVNSDHSSVYLCSNQKMPNLEVASPYWGTWFAKHDDLELKAEEKGAFDNITVGPDPEKIVEPEPVYYEANEEYDESSYADNSLATPDGMCSTCEDDELSVYDLLLQQDNFDPDEFGLEGLLNIPVENELLFYPEAEGTTSRINDVGETNMVSSWHDDPKLKFHTRTTTPYGKGTAEGAHWKGYSKGNVSENAMPRANNLVNNCVTFNGKKLCGDIAYLPDDMMIDICSALNSVPELTSATVCYSRLGHGLTYRHERHQAVDISKFNGHGYGSAADAAEKGIEQPIRDFVSHLYNMGYCENGKNHSEGRWDEAYGFPNGLERCKECKKVVIHFGDPNHNNHVHVSNREATQTSKMIEYSG
jgi:hypothetical protein